MQPTAPEIAQAIIEALPDYSPDVVSLYVIPDQLHLAGRDSVWISVYSVPMSSPSLDKDNSRHQCKISITEDSKIQKWLANSPAPDRVRVELFSGRRYPILRSRACSPEKAAQYVVDYFAHNINIFFNNF